ncbi:MAG: hypothetical protein A3G81_17255 [Betaproteobacteria bacterium RIFCSPLOWO2_12_FULL_65_14]|nr:MAG: hypothetical protein A3G81_17255 [Betaproteobacteria bacterium RIFCSPLOWO2_12_FULL_65_14]
MIQSLEELVVPGRVLRLFCSFTDPPKEKFVVIVATNPFCLGFLINSSPTELQKAKKHLSDELIRISKADGYEFLTNPQPSVLDCTLAADFRSGRDGGAAYAGLIAGNGLHHRRDTRAIIAVVKKSMTLEGGIAKIIIRNLAGS